jgi:dehydrogenase/reductase SDR family protein 1
VVCDHTDDAQVKALFDGIDGEIDVLVNNVWGGYAAYHENRYGDMEGPFWEQPLRVWDDMFAAGVRAHYAATVFAVRKLRPGGLVATVSFFPGSYLNGDDQVAYSVAEQLRPRQVTAVALYPGLVRTEGVLRAGDFFDLSNSESPEFIGRAVVALAGDPEVARLTGQCLVVAELAESYGFTDVDGARPATVRPYFASRSASAQRPVSEPPAVT